MYKVCKNVRSINVRTVILNFHPASERRVSFVADVKALMMYVVIVSSMMLIDDEDRSSHVSGVSTKMGSTW